METHAWTDEELVALFDRVNNAGRWGSDDELGTLNYITAEKRRNAAALVREGRVLSLALPLVPEPPPSGPSDLEHEVRYYRADPADPLRTPGNAGDHLALELHQHRMTHLDAVSHIVSHEGKVYNDVRFEDVAADEGVSRGSIYAQRNGIFSRGVLLDIPAALRIDWLDGAHAISVEELEAAERHGGVEVSRGDVLVIRAGVEPRDNELGRSALVPGPGPDAVLWFHEREIAVYAGDAPERLTEVGARILGLLPPPGPGEAAARADTSFPVVLHQIGIPAMGLVLLDYCRVEELAAACRELDRYEFLFVAAPLALPGGTGSPVNPLAAF